ncbi:MAG: isoprenylcysteine carboxylmethyltransferase family protein [Desulfurococcales archaeon]|nr:isoprenylcysteine carboxylmethyltransferase family protein [Desulfurococcales archaeon]
MRQAWKFVYWPIIWIITLVPPYYYSTGYWRLLSGYSLWVFRALGAVVFVYSILLSSIGGRTLRLYAHSTSESFWPDRLVKIGIYSCMRHPQHLGLVFMPVSLALLAGSPIAFLGSGWAVVGALLFVLFVEEPECLSKYGESYAEYMSTTPAFNLNPKCLSIGFREIRRRN